MKPNELMINDCVFTYEACDGSILHHKVLGVDARNSTIYLSNRWCDGNGDGIHPEPLTNEMLELNGFGYDSSGKIIATENGSLICCISDKETAEMSTTIYEDAVFYCKYVHQLQHALRLCGLHEIADNFIVEQMKHED